MTFFWFALRLAFVNQARQLTTIIKSERETYRKMIFVSGPRQVGKTTVINELRKSHPGPMLNWDNLEDRRVITKSASAIFSTNENVYFDEIHKAPRWKNFLKGYFDKYGEQCQITVTGSAKLDIYRRGGDSMLGRYIVFRLHPFTVGELLSPQIIPQNVLPEAILNTDDRNLKEAQEHWDSLQRYGGFPEPYIRQSDAFVRRWRRTRIERLIREDIRDLSRIRELALLEQMVTLIPERAAQLYSMNALRESLEVSHDSVTLWSRTLEDFYYLYLIPPFSKRIARALKKERKLYLWDYSEVIDPGARFENMVASHLLAWAHKLRDLGFPEITLNYLRNKEKEEVDFVILQERRPIFLVEAKLRDQAVAAQAIRLSQQLGGIPVIQLVNDGGVFTRRNVDGVSWSVMSASRFFKAL